MLDFTPALLLHIPDISIGFVLLFPLSLIPCANNQAVQVQVAVVSQFVHQFFK